MRDVTRLDQSLGGTSPKDEMLAGSDMLHKTDMTKDQPSGLAMPGTKFGAQVHAATAEDAKQ